MPIVMMIDDPFETELWLLALSKLTGLHRELLWPGFDDSVNRVFVAVKEKVIVIRATA